MKLLSGPYWLVNDSFSKKIRTGVTDYKRSGNYPMLECTHMLRAN